MAHSPRKITLYRRLLLDTLVILLLGGYVLLGIQDVPLHGDESTTIWTSEDFDLIVGQRKFDAIFYQDPPRRTTEQHMRIITANFSKAVMGTTWHLAGFTVDDLPEQWVWSPDHDILWNRDNGHVPSNQLLFFMRLSSALLTVLSMALLLATTRMVALMLSLSSTAATVASYTAALLYTLHPNVLVNGRRAMFEGGLLFGTMLVAWLVVWMLRHWWSLNWRHFAVLGVATGLTLTTKHSVVFTVVLLYVGLLLAGVLWGKRLTLHLTHIALATAMSLFIFVVTSPQWWSNPFQMPQITIEQRREILDLQVNLYGGYDDVGDRLQGLWGTTIGVDAQYFEADYWVDFAGVQSTIDNYEAAALAGWQTDDRPIAIILRLILLLAGTWLLQKYARSTNTLSQIVAINILIWGIGLGIITVATNPVPWQRYYLPLQAPLALVMGLGTAWFVEFLRQR